MTRFHQDKQRHIRPGGSLMVALFCAAVLPLGGCATQPADQTSGTAQSSGSVLHQISAAHQSTLPPNTGLADTAPDAYWNTFISSGFQRLEPQVEILPDAESAADTEQIEVSTLHQVEVWNYLIGAEKTQILERARSTGNPYLPAPAEWDAIGVASGADSNGRTVIFLVPAAFGQLISGQQVTVELSEAGTPGIVRYVFPGKPPEELR